MTVYIDLLFFLNLVVDYCIISLTARLSGAAAGFLRQLGGAAAGALFSFVIFLPTLPLPLEWGIRLLLSAGGSLGSGLPFTPSPFSTPA